MKIAICDDEVIHINILRRHILAAMNDRGENNIEITGFTDGRELISKQLNTPFDVVFLDIKMPDVDGRKLAKCLRRISGQMILVYFSSDSEYVFDSFESGPVGFIRKSMIEDDVRRITPLILRKFNEYHEKLEITEDEEIYTFYPSRIWFFESKRRYLLAYYNDHQYEKVKYPIRKMTKLLRDKGFIRTHKSFLVNYRYIYSIGRDTALLIDMETEIPLTKNRVKQIRTEFFDWVGGRK